ncbi:Cilia- and flagella-associated protein 298 (Protein kurly homolog), partial [Durusdinium trenchii]
QRQIEKDRLEEKEGEVEGAGRRMVVLVVKRSEKEQFLFETTCASGNDELVRTLVLLWNLRLKVELLAGAVEELAKYGPAKAEAEKGLDDVQDQAREAEGGARPDRGANYTCDPTGNRTGEAPSPQLQQVLNKVAEDAKQAISAAQVRAKVALSVELLEEKLATIRGAVTMAFPMGLPAYDPIRMALEDTTHTQDIYGEQQLDPETAQLWWAGKEFLRDQTVGDRVGRNEKTKIIVKLQKPGSGPPAREAAVSEDERKAMMAHYFRKQEEMKRLAENNADDYLNSPWADPSNLRRSLNGTGDIRFR